MEKAPAKIQIELITLQCNSILRQSMSPMEFWFLAAVASGLLTVPAPGHLTWGACMILGGGLRGGVFYIKHAVRF